MTSIATFSDTMTNLTIGRKADNRIFNTVRGQGYPVNVGIVNEVLWTSRTEIALAPSGTQTFDISYIDPTGAGTRVALVPASGVTPVATTDYTMGSIPFGADLTANLTYTVNTWGGNTANVTITNGAAVTGYIDFLQLRGMIIRIYEPVVNTQTDNPSKLLYGDRAVTYAMPYQNNVNTVQAFATWLLSIKKDPHSNIDSLEFVASANDTLMAAAMAIDVGKQITVIETVSGIGADFFVNKYTLTPEPGRLTCKLENLEALSYIGVIGIWGTDASNSTYWGPGGSGNWVF